MKTVLITVGFGVGIMAIFFILMSVRLLFVKNGSFKGTCASSNQILIDQGITCACGKKAGECQNG